MNKMIVVVSLVFCILGLCIGPGLAQESRENNIMLVVDGSHLMKNKWGKETRIDLLGKALPAALQEVAKTPDWGYNMGMRMFGEQSHLSKGDCADLRLGTPIEWMNPGILTMVLESIRPKGRTCLSHGIYSAVDDFKEKGAKAYNCVVVIASGKDDCEISETDACNFLITKKQAVSSVHLVGLNLGEKDAKHLKTIINSANGYFTNVTDPKNLQAELVKVFTYSAKGLDIPAPKPPTETPAE